MTSNTISAANDCHVIIDSRGEILQKAENGALYLATYKLVRLELPESLFILVAELNGEYEGICLGKDPQNAQRIFSLVCEHGVMPGTLDETIRDIKV